MRTRAWVAVALSAFSLGALLRPASADEVEEEAAGKAVAKLLADAPAADVPKLWDVSKRLEVIGSAALPALREASSRPESGVRLAVGRALVLLEDQTKGLEVLRKLVEETATPIPHRTAALTVVAREGEEEEAEWLAKAVDTTLEPPVKVAMAKAMWVLPGGDKAKAKAVLVDFLKSSDRDRRAEGALALGEIGAADEAKPILQELRSEPTERGRSAGFLLDRMNAEAVSDGRLLASQTGTSGKPNPAASATKGDWPLLDEMKHLLDRTYVDERIDPKKLEDGAAAGLTKSLDAHTEYLSPEENAKLLDSLDPTYGGVGAYVQNDPDNASRFTISRPIYGGPIYRAGLRSGDIIDRIDGESTLGLPVDDCVRRLKGPAGTTVTITVMRPGWTEPQDFVLTRANITIPTVAYDLLPGGIGYLQIFSFSEDTAREVHEVLDQFARDGIRGLVVDVRWNGGGYLKAAVEIVSEFVKEGAIVVTERGRKGVYPSREHRALGLGSARPQVPMVVIVNGFTASAAEILAGSLRAHQRARVIGTMTYGKGSVQAQNELASRTGEAFVDVERYETIDFRDLNKNGRVDPGEPARRFKRKNGRYDTAEKFTDANGNGRHDEAEPFVDANGNQEWDAAEAFTDVNKNGKWDPGAAFKVTVARYYLPDDTHLEGKYEKMKDGKVVRKGGITPDLEAKPAEIDYWELHAQQALVKTGVVRRYVEEKLAKDKAVLEKLARSDRRDPSSYPGFDEMYDALDTKLSKQAVRVLVRMYARRHVEESLGREFVGDLVDDVQIQAALRDLLATLQLDPKSVPDLAFLAEVPTAPAAK